MTKNTPIFLFALAVGVGFFFQGSRGLYETSEGRYAECGREMLDTGNYLVPQLRYEPHLTKPPLTYWPIAGGLKLLGRNEWGARLYNAVAFALTVWAVTLMGAVLWDRNTGLIAGLIYASSPFPALGAYSITTDTLLTLWITATVLCYLKASKEQGKRQRLYIAAMWICLGLAVLTKGPAALLLFFPVLLWHLFHRKQVRILSWVGIPLFLLLGLGWYLFIYVYRPESFSYILDDEILGRFSGRLHQLDAPNSQWYQPFLIYLPLLALGGGVWSYCLVKHLPKQHVLRFSVLRSHWREGRTDSFLLLWLGLPLAVFCLAKSRLPLYVLPLFVPMALAAARGVCNHCHGEADFRGVIRLAVWSGLVLIGIKAAPVYFGSEKDMKPVYAICRTVQKPQTRFIAFRESKLFGLQFYLRGNLTRIFTDNQQVYRCEGYMEDLVPEIRQSGDPESYVFISSNLNFSRLEGELKEAGLPYQTQSTKYWHVCTLLPQSAGNPIAEDSKDTP